MKQLEDVRGTNEDVVDEDEVRGKDGMVGVGWRGVVAGVGVWTSLEERRIGGREVEEGGESDVAEDAELLDPIDLVPCRGLRIRAKTVSDAWNTKGAGRRE